MNRLQKKCIIASTGLHLLLALILLVGPGFLSSRSKEDNTPQLDFIPLATIDGALSGGGDNTVKAPPAALVTPPTPPSPPAPVAPPEPVTPPVTPAVAEKTPEKQQPTVRETPTEVKLPKNDAPSLEIPRKHKIVVDTKLVTTSAADAKATRDAAKKAAAAAERRQAEAVARALSGIRGGVAGSTEVKLGGPGGGGIPYANFRSAVQKVYWDAWNVPEGVPNVTVEATVTIARDGTVITARIINSSGNATVDASVQRTLDRVKFAAPLPESAKEDSRPVTIDFNTEAKLTG
ncbi:MAG TPA: TonB family protein [Verrucomicrobiae bacterium]|jgi:TonB family protein